MRRGLTLIEMVVAILVAVVLYVAVADLLRLLRMKVDLSRHHLAAQSLATALFEAATSRADLISGRGVPDALADAQLKNILTGGAKGLETMLRAAQFKVAVARRTSVGKRQGLEELKVTITWKEGHADRTRTYGRLILR